MFTLYILKDPITSEIRYVGITKKSLKYRLSKHSQKLKERHDHKSNWMRKLQRLGYVPFIEALQTFTSELDVLKAEVYWIAYFKSIGCDLTNSCAGGRGSLNPSEEALRKMRGRTPWNAGKKDCFSAETLLKISEGSKGRTPWCAGKKDCFSAETLKRMSDSHKGQHSSPATQFKPGHASPNRKPVIDSNGVIYSSLKEAALKLECTSSSVFDALNGRSKTCKGLTFQYYEKAA